MKALAFTISFLLAFLLFAVQPMATKMVLPTLGGTPAVWNTAMLTFQILLLAGYAYAHWLTGSLRPRQQWRVHALLIAASFLFLPLAVTLVSNDALLHQPIRHLAIAFLIQIGLPFFVLSATAPLLQSWVSRSDSELAKTPYVLYSASNLGSMMGLLGYVALIEPAFTLSQQSQYWSMLFVAGTGLLLVAGLKLKPREAAPMVAGEKPRGKMVALWVWLAFLPSALSLGVTSYITTDIAAVPLLWVLPLALYLLSFVDAFRTRPLIVPLAIRVAPILGMAGMLAYDFGTHRFSEIFIAQLFVFALLAFALHGWLARLKPAPQHLTAFYFSMSVGGALGGVLNAIVAPLVFTETIEYPISLLLASVTGFILWQGSGKKTPDSVRAHVRIFVRVFLSLLVNTAVFYLIFGLVLGDFTFGELRFNGRTLLMAGSFALLAAILVYRRYAHVFYATAALGLILLFTIGHADTSQTVFKDRSFFGVWKVADQKYDNVRMLVHNTTLHSAQLIKQDGPLRPLSYYRALTSVFLNLPVLHQHPFALMGLGAGTVKCFAGAQQRVDLFEIDPMVVRLAEDRSLFRYLSDCPGTYEVFLGDGRIMLGKRPDARYGGVILDAFSSDSVPAHLVTLEALRMYFDKLAPHGVLLMHTTNRHISMWPLVATQAKHLGVVAYAKYFSPNNEPLVFQSYWVAMARDEADLAPLLRNDKGWEKLTADDRHRPWTDDYINILPYLKFLHRE